MSESLTIKKPAGCLSRTGGELNASSMGESLQFREIVGDKTAFIPAALDDAGLTATQFRIYCRISRRGDCHESVPNIATGCGLHPDTVWPALKVLLERGMISRSSRCGATSTYQVSPSSQWIKPTGKEGVGLVQPTGKRGVGSTPQPTGKRGVGLSRPTGKEGVATHWKARGGYPLENKGHEGSPLKVLPFKVERNPQTPAPSSLELLGTDELQDLLEKLGGVDWEAMADEDRRERAANETLAELVEPPVEPKATDAAKAPPAADTIPPERQQPITATTGPPATIEPAPVKPEMPTLAAVLDFAKGLTKRPDAEQVATDWHREFAANPKANWRRSLSSRLLGGRAAR